MKLELKAKIEALVAEVAAAAIAGEADIREVLLVALTTYREAGGPSPGMGGAAAGILGAMVGAGIFSRPGLFSPPDDRSVLDQPIVPQDKQP
jgi:hypothetical protein